MKRVRTFFKGIYFSFPIQLLLNHIKKNQVLLFIWLILFGFVTQQIASIVGVPYLFLDPEYMNTSDYRGYLIIGISLGVFISSFHITTYILDSYRFPFLGNIADPFPNFCLNNSIIPVAFVITYLVAIFKFQTNSGAKLNDEVFWSMGILVAGIIGTIFLLFLYFKFTNRDIFKELAKNVENSLRKNTITRVNVLKKMSTQKRNKYKVEYYLDLPFKVRLTPKYNTYDKSILSRIFDQNHLNAVIVEIVIILVIITLGMFRDYSWFQIPAAASGILFFAIFVMFTGAFSYWLKGWAMTVLFISLVVINLLFKFDIITSSYQVYGINYHKNPAAYNTENLHSFSNKRHMLEDEKKTIQILENWKNKFDTLGKKPKMFIVCTSGGGQRAAAWTTRTLQVLDSVLGGRLMPHTAMMTGASGGLIGAAYYRELYLRKQNQQVENLYHKKYFDNIAKDVLNPIIFSMVVNDIFFRFQKFSDGKYEYLKDRGYAFEHQIIRNTDNFLNRRLKDYKEPEAKAQIPMLLISPTVVNDGRKLFISPQDISYMTRPATYQAQKLNDHIKGIEFQQLFKKHDAENLHFMSALRMSATFPYITPNVDLPSEPSMEIMDAGLSDNFGITNAVHFIHVFKDWIQKNTSGVVFILIRDSEKENVIDAQKKSSLMQKLLTPIGTLYSNWDSFQDFNNGNLLELTKNEFENKFEVVEFQYIPNYSYYQENKEIYSTLDNYEKDRAALSWHLTQREKNSLYRTIFEPNNVISIKKIQKLLAE